MKLFRCITICIIVTAAAIGSVVTRADAEDASGLCREAARRATAAYGLPDGLLLAIGTVESGQRDPATGKLNPWPWSVDVDGNAAIFRTKAAAIAWVQNAQAHGIASIDVGCFQVNLFYHPQAFADADAAFDPMQNANYAARLLLRLHAVTNDWQKAIGLYHSGTPALAASYQKRVASISRAISPKMGRLEQLQLAWQATFQVAEQSGSETRTPLGELRLAWEATFDNRQRPATPILHKTAPQPPPVRALSRWRKTPKSRTLVAGLASPSRPLQQAGPGPGTR